MAVFRISTGFYIFEHNNVFGFKKQFKDKKKTYQPHKKLSSSEPHIQKFTLLG